MQVALRVGHGHTRAWASRSRGQRAGRRPARRARAGTWSPAAPGRCSRAPGPGPARALAGFRAPPAATDEPAPLRASPSRQGFPLPCCFLFFPLALCTGGLRFWLRKGPAKMLSWKLRILTPCARLKLLLPRGVVGGSGPAGAFGGRSQPGRQALLVLSSSSPAPLPLAGAPSPLPSARLSSAALLSPSPYSSPPSPIGLPLSHSQTSSAGPRMTTSHPRRDDLQLSPQVGEEERRFRHKGPRWPVRVPTHKGNEAADHAPANALLFLRHSKSRS